LRSGFSRPDAAGKDERMVSLEPATRAERPALESLFQLYAYDWSELGRIQIGADGHFAVASLEPYWRDDHRHPFLIRVDGKLAGFALVVGQSRLSGAIGVFDMAEFFVMRMYRRKGVGQAAAAAAFGRFSGPWEIRQRDENVAATAFWRRAIAHYTGGRYTETHWDNTTWTGPVQTFTTKGSSR
jgi:predicted acetyltransferase